MQTDTNRQREEVLIANLLQYCNELTRRAIRLKKRIKELEAENAALKAGQTEVRQWTN